MNLAGRAYASLCDAGLDKIQEGAIIIHRPTDPMTERIIITIDPEGVKDQVIIDEPDQ